MRIHVRSTQPDGHYRAGCKITSKGLTLTVYPKGEVEPGGINEAELAQMQRDPRLVVTDLPEGTEPPVASEDALKDRVKDVIENHLGPADFQSNGKPKTGAIKEALPEDAAQITTALRDEVWDELLAAAGTAAPQAPPET
ncbi:MAG: hypothetical protein AAGF71_06080 [Pseudomonadota bacterium]